MEQLYNKQVSKQASKKASKQTSKQANKQQMEQRALRRPRTYVHAYAHPRYTHMCNYNVQTSTAIKFFNHALIIVCEYACACRLTDFLADLSTQNVYRN